MELILAYTIELRHPITGQAAEEFSLWRQLSTINVSYR